MDDATKQALTEPWIRNKADEFAVSEGCWFEVSTGAFAVWWIENHCVLYEGENAGEPVLMRSGNPDLDKPILGPWDEVEPQSIQRALDYVEWRKTADVVDWQYDCTMSVFGWVKYSERLGREIRRFTQSSIWIPKKSKKTPSLAAWSLYLTCGDGEKGAKTFGGAKDGNQAKIAAAHAIAMVEQSPTLSQECKVNQNEASITHIPTRSVYKPLSSNDTRHKQSKEGINGNIAIDETHVVDRSFIRIISRAGISRPEPLRFDFSTAGNNPDGYGKERQDYIREVMAGRVRNTQIFGRIYEAPQDTTDDAIKRDPIKFGKMANPAWGHTVNQDEFLADFQESVRTPQEFADFKMYRLNIWQQSSNPWIRSADWERCLAQVQLDQFQGERCWIGLDLSKTRDMSAVVLVFRDDSGEEPTFYQFPFFWIPEIYARDNQDKADFQTWGQDGDLEIVPGETIRQSVIKERLEWIHEQFDVVNIAYDKKFASDLIHDFCEPELGWECLEFPQASTHFAGPVAEYENLIVEGRLKHNGNQVLDWQAGHVEVKNTDKGTILCKPTRNSTKKIDGIVAGVMAVSRAMRSEASPPVGSMYDDDSGAGWMG